MNDYEKLFAELQKVERYYGLFGVSIAIVSIIGFFLVWKYLNAKVEGVIKSSVNKELADYNKDISVQLAKFNGGIQTELSRLNNELSFKSANTLSNLEFEREAVVQFVEAYSHWLYGALSFDVLSFDYNNFDLIKDIQKSILLAYSKANEQANKLQFWSRDNKLSGTSQLLISAILKYSHVHQDFLSSTLSNLKSGKFWKDAFQAQMDAGNISSKSAAFYAEEEKKCRDAIDINREKFYKERLAEFKEVLAVNNEFQSLAKDYLKHI